MTDDAEAAELARENAIMNRFESTIRAFQDTERIPWGEMLDVLVSSTAHNLGHSGFSEEVLRDVMRGMVSRLRFCFHEHATTCQGGPPGTRH